MGIDPVTHEPLIQHPNTNQTTNSPSNESDKVPKSAKHQFPEAICTTNLEENPFSPRENCSSDESLLHENNLYDNDPLIACLFGDDPPQVEVPLEFPCLDEEVNNFWLQSWDDTCSWLLDCQDFGVHDFGFDCFCDMETEKALGMGEMRGNQ